MAAGPPQETELPAGRLRLPQLHWPDGCPGGPDGCPGGAVEFSGRLERPVWDGRGGGAVAVLFRWPETLRLASLWSSPFTAWIDLAGLGEDRLDALLDRAADADFLASVTTAAAHDLHVAHRLVAAVRDRGRLAEPAASDIEFALHEAISNALLHGNLELESVKGSSLRDLGRFSDEFASRLGNPVLAARRVEVTMRIGTRTAIVEVSDEGTGFSPRPSRPGCGEAAEEAGASGRGLVLIAGLATRLQLLDGGRRTWMEFAL